MSRRFFYDDTRRSTRMACIAITPQDLNIPYRHDTTGKRCLLPPRTASMDLPPIYPCLFMGARLAPTDAVLIPICRDKADQFRHLAFAQPA